MKDYKTMFNEANKDALEQYKNRKRNKTIFMVFSVVILLVWIIISINFFWVYAHLGPILGPISLLISIGMLSISSGITKKFFASEKDLEAKAKGFAASIIFYDFYSILETLGRCDFERSELKKIITEEHIWFKDGQFVCNDLYFDYEQEKTRFVIIHLSSMFYLTSWRYVEKFPFIFTFDEVNSYGRVQSITMHLSPKEKGGIKVYKHGDRRFRGSFFSKIYIFFPSETDFWHGPPAASCGTGASQQKV